MNCDIQNILIDISSLPVAEKHKREEEKKWSEKGTTGKEKEHRKEGKERNHEIANKHRKKYIIKEKNKKKEYTNKQATASKSQKIKQARNK